MKANSDATALASAAGATMGPVRHFRTRLGRGTLLLGLLLAPVLLGGCSMGSWFSSSNAEKILNPDPPEKMFAAADSFLARGKWEDAAHKFEDLDRDHPYSPQARRAIVMAAYAYYRAGKYPEAVTTARRYTTMHPGTKEAPMAHNIIASSYFDEMNGPKNDQTNTRKALAEYKTLQSRYPDSQFAKEADNRIRICEDTLAAQDMEIGRDNLKKKNYIGSINRFKSVVSDFPTTHHVEEALMRLTEFVHGARHQERGADGRRRARAQLPRLPVVQGRVRAPAVRRPCPARGPGHLVVAPVQGHEAPEALPERQLTCRL